MINSLVFLLAVLNPLFLFFSWPLAGFDQSLAFGQLENWESSLASALEKANPNFIPIRNWNINEPEVEARSAAIFSFNPQTGQSLDFEASQILFAKDQSLILPIASLTKLMTAVIAFEKLDLNQEVIISEKAISAFGGQAGFKAGERLEVKNLLEALLIVSSNDAAYALAEAVEEKTGEGFVGLMNQKANELNLKNTRFAEPSGISPANVSTVYDIGRLVKYSFNYPLIWQITKTAELEVIAKDGQRYYWVNTDQLLNKYQNIIAGKTGYTQEAQGCLMVVYQPEDSVDYLISVVLGAQRRFLETEKLIGWVEKAYAW